MKKLKNPSAMIFVNDGYLTWEAFENFAMKTAFVSLAVGFIAKAAKLKNSHGIEDNDDSHGTSILYDFVREHSIKE